MRLYILASTFPHLNAENEKYDHYKTANSGRHIGNKEYRVVDTVSDNRHDERKRFVPFFHCGIEPGQRLVIAHQDAETKVPWHSKYRTANTN